MIGRTQSRKAAVSVLSGIAGAVLAVTVAAGQTAGPPNALQGFSQNRDKPVHIEAASLEVRDKDKMATFSGNVHVVQGDTTMKSRTLVVFYEAGADQGGLKAAKPGPGGKQQIRRLEAKGGVVVTQKDQTATGETGIYDMQANTVTLSGNVVVSQGPNVTRGDRLVVDLTSGVSRVECNSGQCRVRALIQPGSTPLDKDKNQLGRDSAKPPPGPPIRLN
jgi:lipopolysaccharide export system protein LptA